MFKIEAIETYERFLSLKPEWDNMLVRSDMDVPFMTFEWFDFWQKINCKEGELLILVARNEEGVAGIVPLKKERMVLRGLPVNSIKFMANYYSCRAGIVSDGRDNGLFKAVLDYLACLEYKYDLLYFDMVIADSNTDRQIKEGIQRPGIKYREMPGMNSRHIQIDSDWSSYMKKIPKKLRGNINHKENVIRRAGSYEAVLFRDGDPSKPFSEMMAISRNSWKQQKKSGVAGSLKSVRFYTDLVAMLAAQRWLNLWILYFDGKPISFTLNIEYKKRIYGNQTGYDQGYRQLSPGFVIMMKSIKDAYDRGFEQFDLFDGDEPYKLELTKEVVKYRKYFIFSNTFRGKLLSLFECGTIQWIKTLQQGFKWLRLNREGHS